uniref:PHD-type domain-containing protein n=1 Tax=Eptatretus burgeri TaxID=7764 RepID=A0A8C4NH36_EPTBU
MAWLGKSIHRALHDLEEAVSRWDHEKEGDASGLSANQMEMHPATMPTTSLAGVRTSGATILTDYPESLETAGGKVFAPPRGSSSKVGGTFGSQGKALPHLRMVLARAQELADEKLKLTTGLVELAETRSRKLDAHARSCEGGSISSSGSVGCIGGPGARRAESPSSERIGKRSRRGGIRSDDGPGLENGRTTANGDCLDRLRDDESSGPPSKSKKARGTVSSGTTSGKKKKKRAGRAGGKGSGDLAMAMPAGASPPPGLDLSMVDPDEPTYCLCNQVSYGDMIGCDNVACAIEWFHFGCVGLSHKPKGKWYCPHCRGHNERTMDRALLERARKERGCAR